MRLLRHHAQQWGIDPQRIGVVGASAGGHLALNLVTHAGGGTPGASDPVERLSCRPSFVGLVCPWPGKSKQPMADSPVDRRAPPMFIAAARDDPIAPASFAESIAAACEKARVRARLWVVERGGHAGFRHRARTEGAQWFARYYEWIAEQPFD